jgi:hypothetical protein
MHHAFWAHYCPCEKGLLWVAQDEECSWCGLTCDPILAEDEIDPLVAWRNSQLSEKDRLTRGPEAKRVRD